MISSFKYYSGYFFPKRVVCFVTKPWKSPNDPIRVKKVIATIDPMCYYKQSREKYYRYYSVPGSGGDWSYKDLIRTREEAVKVSVKYRYYLRGRGKNKLKFE